MILMAGCVPPQAIVEDRVVAPALAGIVEPGFIYRIQAPLTDVAYAASVSFIDPTGGPGGIPKTVATTVTTDGGAFNLSLPNFTPTPIAGVFDYPIFGMLDVTLTGIPGGSSQVDFTLTPFSGPASTRSILIPGATASVSIKSLLPGNGWTVMAEARNAANAVWAQTDRIDGPLDPLTLSNRPIAGPYEVKSGRQSWGVGLQVAPISGKAAN